jgi:hypothetical protein
MKGYSYIVSGDSASGLPNRNGAASSILCLETHEQVAAFSGKVAPEDFAVELRAAGWYYNKAEIVVEYEKYGLLVLSLIIDKYPNVYSQSDSFTSMSMHSATNYGWNPVTNRNRQLAVDMLAMDIGFFLSGNSEERAKSIKVYDKDTLLESAFFVRNKLNGKDEAQSGKTDDLVSSLYIANFVWHERNQYTKAAKVEKKRDTIFDMMYAGQRKMNERSMGVREYA